MWLRGAYLKCRRRIKNGKMISINRLRTLLLLITSVTIFITTSLVYVLEEDISRFNLRSSSFKTILQSRKNVSFRQNPTILMWTTVFGATSYYEANKDIFKNVCDNKNCVLTNNKSLIEKADAVVFHFHDISLLGRIQTVFEHALPTYRRPDQVWILYYNEPLTRFSVETSSWQGIFNWTWTYRRNSDVFHQIGKYWKLNETEIDTDIQQKKRLNEGNNYFKENNKGGALAMISDCADEARRYKIIAILKEYINTTVIGRCGKRCPKGFHFCDDLLKNYKFYLAFENSLCVDYVTEKYWRTLQNNQIPIVAWLTPMEGLVVPGSYINVFDFPDMDAAGWYIREVDRNETLYNSYFRWRLTYGIEYYNSHQTRDWCTICDMLQNRDIPDMVYHDLQGWLINDTPVCQPVTVRN